MNQNETRTFFISIGLAVFAMFMFYSYSQSKKAEYDKLHGTYKSVVVAKSDINEMQTIDESMLDVVRVPESFVQPGAITDTELVIGQVAAAPIKEKEQLLRTKILNPGPLTGISLQVSPDMRAISVPIDDARGVNRLIKPGDRIDLVAAVDYGKGAEQRREVKTILQDVTVLATGVKVVNQIPRVVESGSGESETILNLNTDVNYQSIIVEVTPRDAQDLIYIMSVNAGGLYAVLRNPNDRLKKDIPIATVDTVLRKINAGAVGGEIRGQPTQPFNFPQLSPNGGRNPARGPGN
jgi:pilus assembly protein CpaB